MRVRAYARVLGYWCPRPPNLYILVKLYIYILQIQIQTTDYRIIIYVHNAHAYCILHIAYMHTPYAYGYTHSAYHMHIRISISYLFNIIIMCICTRAVYRYSICNVSRYVGGCGFPCVLFHPLWCFPPAVFGLTQGGCAPSGPPNALSL